MTQQYFSREPESVSRPCTCHYTYQGREYRFLTDSGVFSRGEMDPGSGLLLSCLRDVSGSVLDLGCGWGALGICVKGAWPQTEMTMVDVNLRALELCRQNLETMSLQAEVLESDGFSALRGRRFHRIITNPPIRAGKQKVYELLRDASLALETGGRLDLVIRKQQGGDSCIRFLGTCFRHVEKIGRSGGYWVLEAAEPTGEEMR